MTVCHASQAQTPILLFPLLNLSVIRASQFNQTVWLQVLR